MADDLVVLDGSTFFVSDQAGDVRGEGTSGLFFQDVRHLSSLSVSIDGAPLRVLTSRVVDYYSARVFGTLATARMGLNPPSRSSVTGSSLRASTRICGSETTRRSTSG